MCFMMLSVNESMGHDVTKQNLTQVRKNCTYLIFKRQMLIKHNINKNGFIPVKTLPVTDSA